MITLKKPIWYKIENRRTASVNQLAGNELIHLCDAIKEKSELTESADSLTLQIRSNEDEEYITLDNNLFSQTLSKSPKKLVNHFNNSNTNPIKVTLPGMSLFPFSLLL